MEYDCSAEKLKTHRSLAVVSTSFDLFSLLALRERLHDNKHALAPERRQPQTSTSLWLGASVDLNAEGGRSSHTGCYH